MIENSKRYELRLVVVLALIVGLVSFEMFGIGILMPFIKFSLKLSNTRVGFLLSGFWVMFAISSYLSGVLTDRAAKHKSLLELALLLFSFASLLSACATAFLMLLAARLLMGLLDGPSYLIPQSIIVLESPSERSGFNMGIVQNLGSSVIGAFIGPLLLVHLATRYSWRVGFLVFALPGLICTALVAYFVRQPQINQRIPAGGGRPRTPQLVEVLRCRNVWLSAVASCFVVAYITITFGFLPLFFIQARHLAAQEMSVLMSVLGISGLVLGIALPAASDRIGRKPIMIISSLLGMLCPMAALTYSGPVGVLALLLFIGWAMIGAAPLTFATIPSESVAPESATTAMGLIVALSTIVGGVAAPVVAGWSADKWGLSAPLILEMGCCAIIVAACSALVETAPRKSVKGARSTESPRRLPKVSSD